MQEANAIDPNVAAAPQGAPYSDGDGLLTLLKSARAVNAASAPWNPYAAVIAAALTILSTILGLSLKKNAADASAAILKADAAGLKYKAHKRGVEKTMKQASFSDVADVKKMETVLYNNIGEARAALGVT